MGVDDRKRVDERAEYLIDRLLPPGVPSHPLDESSLVAPIAEDAGMVVSRYDREELFEDVALLVLAIGPERIAMLTVAIAGTTTLFRWIQAYAPELEKRIRPHLRACNGSWRVDGKSYEERCVKSILFSAGRHRPVPSHVCIRGGRGGAPRRNGWPRPPPIPRGRG